MTMTPKEVRAMWADDLEHGGHKQGKGKLGDADQGWCCLGRLEKLAEEHGIVDSYNPEHAVLSPSVMAWSGLRTNLAKYCDTALPRWRGLTTANDNDETFPGIAAIIRAEPDGLCFA